jgi:hypothetical protein
MQLARNFIILSSILISILLISPDKMNNVSAESSYTIQEIKDPDLDWVNMDTRQYYGALGERSTDILAVDYYSNRDFLNATLWLYFPFMAKPNYSSVNYGMLIDADFDKKTGFDGIDYQFEIKWDQRNGVWNNTLEAWSPNGLERTVDSKYNYTGFYEQGGNYVILSLDLDQIGSPSKYKVIFYTEVERDSVSFTDFTRWVALPSPHLVISTSPNSIELHKGEEKTIEVKLNSSQGYEPSVNVYAISTVKNIKVEFPQNDTLRIPTYGLATTPLTISASPDAPVGPYTLFIFANSSFPSEELVEVESVARDDSTFYSTLPTENIVTQS